MAFGRNSLINDNRTPTQQFFLNCFYAIGWYCLALAISSAIVLLAVGEAIGLNLRAIVEFAFQFVPLLLIIVSAFVTWRNFRIAPFIILAAALYYSWISWESVKVPEVTPDNALQQSIGFTVILWFYAIFVFLLTFKRTKSVGLKQ
jgi:hypothetical protein